MFAHAATQLGIDQHPNPLKKQRNNTQSTDGEGTDPQSVCEGKKTQPKTKCGRNTQKEPAARVTMKQQTAPQSRQTSNVGQQWSLPNDEANAPFTIDNGGVNRTPHSMEMVEDTNSLRE